MAREEQMDKCIACEGTGKSSKGKECVPCKGSGGVTSPTGFGLHIDRKYDSKAKVLHGDCREWIPKAAKKVGGFDFIFADPPFNIGQNYSGYEDDSSPEKFSEMIFDCVAEMWAALKPNGVLALHGPNELVTMYLVIENGVKLTMNRIAWVNWHYRFGQHSKTNWINSRTHCLIYAHNPDDFTFNADAVLVASDRAAKYGDKRTDATERPGQRLPGTVWGVEGDGPHWGRVTGDNRERQKESPNQLPEVYLERLIRAYTNPGDTVLDPFGGSGTTAVVAMALGRNAVTIDVSKTNVEIIKERLKKGAVRL